MILSNSIPFDFSSELLLEITLQSVCLFILWGTCMIFLRTRSAAFKTYLTVLFFLVLSVLPFMAARVTVFNTGLIEYSESVASKGVVPKNDSHVQILSPDPGNTGPPSVEPMITPQSAWIANLWRTVAFSLIFLIGIEAVTMRALYYWRSGSSCFLQGELNLLQRKMGISRSIQLILSGSKSPLTLGLFRPVIVLPESSAKWKIDKIRNVLMHELAHIKRYDYMTNILVNIVCAIYWFNPLVWFAAAAFRLECEKSCDDYVVTKTADRITYAALLLSIAERQPHFATGAGSSRVALLSFLGIKRRIAYILNPRVNRCHVGRKEILAMSVAAIVALITISTTSFVVPVHVRGLESTAPAVFDPRIEDVTVGIEHDRGKLHSILRLIQYEQDAERLVQLIAAVGKLGLNHTFYSLADRNNTENVEVKRALLGAFGQISCFPSFLLLAEGLHHKNQSIRSAAEEALSVIQPAKLARSTREFIVPLTYADENYRRRMKSNLSMVQGSAVIRKLQGMYLADESVRLDWHAKIMAASSRQDYAEIVRIVMNES